MVAELNFDNIVMTAYLARNRSRDLINQRAFELIHSLRDEQFFDVTTSILYAVDGL